MTARQALTCRYGFLISFAIALGVAPLIGRSPPLATLAVLAAASFLALRAGFAAVLCALVMLAGAAGLALGAQRLAAIDGGMLALEPGAQVRVVGPVAAPPRLSDRGMRLIVSTRGGSVLVETRELDPTVEQGRFVVVRGEVRETEEWERGAMLRSGVSSVVAATSLRSSQRWRGGVAGVLDGIRHRAEAALVRGNPDPASSLLRGFILGQDDRIATSVREEFRRSGLAHVLAVSGQNVMLLALLAVPMFSVLGMGFRSRLIATLAVVALYVPVAGAGASIQRAGVMGAAGLLAILASRPRARWYGIWLAAAVTLAINPRATGDIGWQLSFAAVVGLLTVAPAIAGALRGPPPVPASRRFVSEGLAMTLAATLATGPLVALHFEVISLTAIPANALALPAIAPAMWLGMLAGALGQVPGAPVEALSWLGGLFAGYIGWVAGVLGGERAQVGLSSPGPLAALVATAGLLAGAGIAARAWVRRGALLLGNGGSRIRSALWLAAAAAMIGYIGMGSAANESAPSARLVLRVLDVGQGDAILLAPRRSLPVLIDTGPPGGAAAGRLHELGIDHLGALVLTHDDSDHSGALGELLAGVRVDRLLVAASLNPQGCSALDCPPIIGLATGQVVRSGALRLSVLWPPPGEPTTEAAEPNARSLVVKASIGEFDALLTGDAEAELAPVRPGPVEVLKVAHHGSADAGLQALLEQTAPGVALLSVGAGNPYGHPAVATIRDLELAGASILRTDRDGEIVILVRDSGWSFG